MTTPPAKPPAPPVFPLSRRQTILTATGLVILSGLGVLWGSQSGPKPRKNAPSSIFRSDDKTSAPLEGRLTKPATGGLARTVVQTGTISAYESADLFARVSGTLQAVHVEIGDVVEEGQLLAEIDAPELQKDIDRQKALVQQAESSVKQAEARLATVKAERQAAEGRVEQAKASFGSAQAELSFRAKELERIRKLAGKNAVERKLVDEKLHQWESARSAQRFAEAAQLIAQGELAALHSRIEQARADIVAAQADERVARAELARAEVLEGFTKITAPFAGVVTERQFDRGSFVRSATEGATRPLLRLSRTDRMRIVVQIPDPDVPFVKPGQAANVCVDILGGKTFKGTVSRIARRQDRRTRTMRAEIDLTNANGELVGGMYGAVTITIPAPKRNQTLPEACLVGKGLNGRGKVYVFSGGKLSARELGLGRIENGLVEVLSNLLPTEDVVAVLPPGVDEDLDGRPAIPQE